MTVETNYNPTKQSGNGVTTSFSFAFEVASASDIVVYQRIADVQSIVPDTDYTVQVLSNGGNVIFNTAPAQGTIIVIDRDTPQTQDTPYKTSSGFPAVRVEENLDKLTLMVQELQYDVDRSPKVDETSSVDPEVLVGQIERVYSSIDNVDTVADDISNVNAVAGNATNINAVAGNATNINTVAGDKTNIDAVAGNKTNIDAVAGNATNINTVAGISSNVTTVAGISSDVTTVAGISSDVTAVKNNATDISTVAGDITKVTAVADDLTNIDAVNANKTNINKVATDINKVKLVADDISSVNTVAVDISNVIDVAGNKTNIDTVAGISSNVTTVAGISGNVTTVAGIASDVTAVKNNATNINAVAGNSTNITAVAGNATNINTVATNATNINAVAGDLTNIDTAVANLPAINAAPTYADNAKKWAEGTDAQVSALGGTHSSKGWAEIAEAAASGVQNPANRDLSNLTAAGQLVIDSQNGTISNCILEIPQNIKIELSNGVLTLKAGSIVTLSGSTYQTVTTTADISLTNTSNGTWFLTYSNGAIARSQFGGTSGDTPPENPTTSNLWFDTTTREVKRYSSGTWYVVSYPLCAFKTVGGVTTEFVKDSNGNDMIFNGAGFVGTTLFVYPNIKGLIPNGFNEDGSLKSIEFTTNSVSLNTRSGARDESYIIINQNASISVSATISSGNAFYDEEKNLFYNNGYGTYTPILSFSTLTGGKIDKFAIYQPVRLATTEMLDKKQDTITGAATSITSSDLTASKALISDASGKVSVSAVTSTELEYLSGVTSAIQTQINGKQAALTFDTAPTQNSTNPVESGGVYTALSGKQDTSNLVTSVSSASTDSQYPSAKLFYDTCGDIETLINAL